MDKDSLSLLGDCTAGINRTLSAMDTLLPNIKDRSLRRKLRDSVRE